MTSKEIIQQLATLGLKKHGVKATLEDYLLTAQKMDIPSSSKIIEIHAEIPTETQLEIQTITEISKAFPAIQSQTDLEIAVELRFNRIALAKDLISRLLQIDQQEIEIQLARNSFNKSKEYMQRLLEPLEQADEAINQRMIEYEQINQQQQTKQRDNLLTMMVEQSEKDILEKAEQLIEDGKISEATKLLDTLDDEVSNTNDALELVLPKDKKVKTKVEGATFTSGWDWKLNDIKKVKSKYLRPQVENKGEIRKVVTEYGIAAEKIVGGIIVTEKPGVRKSRKSDSRLNEVLDNVLDLPGADNE